MADERENTKISVPIKLVNTRNVLIFSGIILVLIGAVVIFNHKSKLAKAVTDIKI